MRRPTAWLVVSALALTGAAAAGASTPTKGSAAVADAHVKRAPVSARAAAALGPGGELRGMALNDLGTPAVLDATIADFPRMRLEGITSVTAYVYLHLASPTSNEVTTSTVTPTDQELTLATSAAHAAGLDMHFMPVLTDDKLHPRGDYIPSDTNAFFASYTTILNHYADLAQTNGVTLLYVGSENDSITKYEAQWRRLVASVRQHYSGALSYMSIGYRGLQVKWWNALDLMSLSTYYSLGDEKTVSYGRVRSAWMKDHLPYLATIAKQVKVPLVMGEIGYRSETGGYQAPAFDNKGSLPSPQAQATAYAALLDSLATSPYVYGITWWRWSGVVPTVTADMGYSPAGKPAECVLAKHWTTNDVVRQLASLPVCDLSAVDTVTTTVASHVPVLGK